MSRYKTPLFPIAIFHGRVDNNRAIKELVFPLIEKHKNTNPPKGWLTNKLITSFGDDQISNEFLGDGEIGTELKNQYVAAMGTFFNNSFLCDITDMWYNTYVNGEYQEAHTHFGNYKRPNHYACVHFLNFNHEIHEPLTFLDPIRHMRATSHEFTGFSGYSDNYKVNAREGDLIMFPVYLEHEVRSAPPTPDYPRITISFNIRITEFGEEVKENESD